MSQNLEALLAALVVERGEEHMRWVLAREQHTKPTEQQLAAVREQYGSNEVEIDDDAYLSESELGYWVSGWLWVEYPFCDRCSMTHDPALDCSPDDVPTGEPS